MSEAFDPYHKWLGIRKHEHPLNHYRLLGLDLFESDSDAIDSAANRQTAFLRQHASGPHSALSQKLLNEVSEAQVCLLVPEKKAAYDKTLRATIAAREAQAKPAVTEKKPIPVERKAPPKKLTKEEIASLYQISLQLMEKYDFAQTIEILESIPKGLRNNAVEKLYERATRLEEQSKTLVDQMNEAVTQYDDATAEKAARQLLKLKPGHQGAKRVLRDAVEYGAGGAQRLRRKAGDKYKAIGMPAIIFISSVASVVLGVSIWGLMHLMDYLGRDGNNPIDIATNAISSDIGDSTDEVSKVSSPPSSSNPNAPPVAVAPFDTAQAKQHQQTWASYLQQPVEYTNSIGMKLAVIPPAADFKMGPGSGVSVSLSQPYRIGIHEVTQGQWQTVMGTEPWKGQPQLQERPESPANYVSSDDAEAFCEKLTQQERAAGRIASDQTYRLPTDAEWEWACRAGTTTANFFNGDETQLPEYAWFDANTLNAGEAYPHAVGLKRPNAFGLFDTYGNLSEWCADYKSGALPGGRDPLVTAQGADRINRGGHWRLSSRIGKSSERGFANPTGRGPLVGFRVALTVSAPAASAAPPTGQLVAQNFDVEWLKPRLLKESEIWSNYPAYLNDSLIFDVSDEKRPADFPSNRLSLTVNADGIILMATSWQNDGNSSGGWYDTRTTEEDLTNQGWEKSDDTLTRTRQNEVYTYTIFRKAVKKGDKLQFHTRKYNPPLVFANYSLPGTSPATTSTSTPGTPLETCEQALLAADASVRSHAFADSLKFCSDAQNAATSLNDPQLLKHVADRTAEIEAAQQEWLRVQAAAEKTPVATADKRDVGLYLCSVEDRWAEGLKMLGDSNDPALSPLAKKDLANPTLPSDQVSLANEWYLEGGKHSGRLQSAIRSRAGYWYEQALPQVTDATFQQFNAQLLNCPYQDVHRFLPRTITLQLSPQVTANLRLIPPGTFQMKGVPAASCDVTLTRPVYMAATEVTHAQWQAVIGTNPSGHTGDPEIPVWGIDWNGLQAFPKAMQQTKTGGAYDVRLPTEAEWEYACRVGTSTPYHWGTDATKMAEHAWIMPGSENKLHPAGQLKPNRWGLYDMYGNMWEWTNDYYQEYPNIPVVDPRGGPKGDRIAVRGGSWLYPIDHANSYVRRSEEPTRKDHYFGFRFVCVPR